MTNKKILNALIPLFLLPSSALAGNFFAGVSAGVQKDQMKTETATPSSTGAVFDLNLGYAGKIKSLHLITEIGAAMGTGKMKVDNSDNSIYNKYIFSLSQKIGYEFFNNNLSYVNLGANLHQFKAESEDKDYGNSLDTIYHPTYTLGLGHQYNVNDNVKVFGELNYLQTLSTDYFNSDSDAINNSGKFSSLQFKIGVRYYF